MGLEIFERGTLPRWRRIRQQLVTDEITDVAGAVAAALSHPRVDGAIQPGSRVALAVGSRGKKKKKK